MEQSEPTDGALMEQKHQSQDSTTTSAAESDGAPAVRRGPSVELERRIGQAIAARQQLYASAAASSDVDHEPTILGTYEYLDHTADVQLHAWGETMQEALEQLAVSMYGYMTDLSRIQVSEEHSQQLASNIQAQGHDLASLVFRFLHEWLYLFHESGFIAREIKIEDLHVEDQFSITSSGRGEVMDLSRHSQGTEVKAITYSNLQMKQADDRCDVWVIVDI